MYVYNLHWSNSLAEFGYGRVYHIAEDSWGWGFILFLPHIPKSGWGEVGAQSDIPPALQF